METLFRLFLLKECHDWDHETALVEYLTQHPDLCDQLGLESVPNQSTLWRSWHHRFTADLQDTVETAARTILIKAQNAGVSVPHEPERQSRRHDNESSKSDLDDQTVLEQAETVTDSGYERTGEYRGHTVFARSDVPRRVAIGDGVIVWTSVQKHEQPNLEALIDAGAGERPRYHEESVRFDQLTAAAGGNAHLIVNTDIHDPTGRPAMLADAFRFDGRTAYQVVSYRYEDGRVPTESALKHALQEDGYRFTTEAETFDVRIDGSLATVEAQVPFNSVREVAPEYDLPQVTWGGAQDADATRVTFRHEAGESVSAGKLYYDLDRPDDVGKIEKQPLWSDSDGDSVSPDAEATVDLSEHPDAEGVSLVYSTGGTHFHVLFTVDLQGGDR